MDYLTLTASRQGLTYSALTLFTNLGQKRGWSHKCKQFGEKGMKSRTNLAHNFFFAYLSHFKILAWPWRLKNKNLRTSGSWHGMGKIYSCNSILGLYCLLYIHKMKVWLICFVFLDLAYLSLAFQFLTLSVMWPILFAVYLTVHGHH